MKIFHKILIINFISISSFAQTHSMKIQLEEYIKKLPTEIKVTMSVESIEGDKLFSYRADEKVPSASVIKIPIMVELMEQAKAGKVNLDEIYEIKSTDKTGGSGVLAETKSPKKLSLRQLCQEMIRVSDNTATNILIKKIGMENVNARLASLGIQKTQLNRVMMDAEAVKQGRENWINVVEINDLLRKIYTKKVVNPVFCDEMMKILENCEDQTTIPAQLPKELKIAHKTGGLPYVRGDAAIVFSKKPMIISVFVQGFKLSIEAEKIISDLALICYESSK